MSGSLRAGAAQVDITPKAGTHLAGSGMGEHRPAQTVVDPLYAKAVVFEAGVKKICIVSLDVTIVTEAYTQHIRDAAANRFGFAPDAVMVHAIQTHSAPSCGHFMLDPDFPLELPSEKEYLRGGETAYGDFAAAGAVDAIGKAVSALEPVQIGWGSGIRADLASNRRGINREGKAVMPFPAGRKAQPLGPTYLRYMEGPIDPEVGILCARNADMEIVAMILHYTCHPVNLFVSDRLAVTADWPGAWAATVQAMLGTRVTPLVLNGCCGNINPWDPFDPDYDFDHRRVGNQLATTAERVIRQMTFADATHIDWRLGHVPLDYRDIPAGRRDAVEQILSDNPHPKYCEDHPERIDPTWFLAASTKSIHYCRNCHPQFPYEVQALRVGDAAIVGLSGEPFVEGQLAIKVSSPTSPTFVAHCTSHYVGYLPTRDAYSRGGHEANPECTYWAKFAPGSLEEVVENAVDLLGELFA